MDHSKPDRLSGYRTEVDFALSMGDGPLLRESRSRISAFSLTQAETDALRALDEIVLEEIAFCENLQPYLLEDDPQIPLTQWWWHLGKIRLKTYPASLLPPELHSAYLAASHQNAAA